LKRFTPFLIAALVLAAPGNLLAQERGAAALAQQIAGVGNTTRVLLIAAHPDDEDTQLISWLTHGQHVETAYLSLTRGDGGQNLIGNELGEALGVIRTAELMSARRIDGAKQYFTRAYDFGFSKDTIDTFKHWPKDSLLRDAVRVVRDFAPHVIVAIFSGTPRDGHGQHQASAIIAKEVWDAAADTVRFPVREYGPAWTPLKFYRNARFSPGEATLKMNVGEYNPVLGKSYFEIAAESRSQHKSQGFGTLQRKGVIWDYLRREETRVPAPADPKAEKSMFDGIDTSIGRLRGEINPACDAARVRLDSLSTAIAALPKIDVSDRATLVRILGQVWANSGAAQGSLQVCKAGSPDLNQTLQGITRRAAAALTAATDLEFEAIVNRPSAAFGDTFTVVNRIHNRGRLPARIRGGATGNGDWITLLPDSSFEYKLVWNDATVDQRSLPFPGTQPRWLATSRNGDLFGTPSHPMDALVPGLDALTANAVAGIDAQQAIASLTSPLTYHVADPVRGDMQLPFTIAPGIAINFDRQVELARAGTNGKRFVNVTVRSAFATPQTVSVSLSLPRGLTADSATRTITVTPNGVRTVTFRLSGALPAGDHDVSATASAGGKTYTVGYVPIEYDHIPPQRMYRPASLRIASIPVSVPSGLNVGYVRGVGDNVPATLQDLGIPVTTITPADLPSTDLSRFSTIVVGTRAYQASQQLIDNASYLLDFVRRGGTLVSQYGQYEMVQPGVMPYPITLSRPADRVTDEVAEVRILDAASPLLSFPNKITLADFNGWTQERASYMPTTFDANYKTVLSMNDPGETPKNSAILVTPYGKGLYIYATLSFFRQLPAGNPGATKLFVNLLSVRKAR
jgi:LmbE family N-acetylglucosaminyl deacetylase